MSIIFIIIVAWLSPMPFFAKNIFNGSIEYNRRLPLNDQLSEKQLKMLALIFGVLWPLYILILIVTFIRIIINPSLLDK